jgi:hypothetical protein
MQNTVIKMNSMKRLILLFFWTFSLLTSCASCAKDADVPSAGINSNHNANSTGSKMKIIVRNSTFTATLHDNATATAFKALLPITVNMVELNGNEKYVDLSRSLQTNATNPGTIQNGDMRLYGSKTLVLFYKSFSTSYSYTKLGRINDPTGLAAALGSGNETVTFELE